MTSAMVVGLAVTGRAVADAFGRRGVRVVAVDDRPSPAALIAAADRGIDLIEAPTRAELVELVNSVDLVVPSPGVPRHHSVYAIADEFGVPVVSELDLAAIWDDRPCLAITGTNGKTTVTTLVSAMLRRSGIECVAAGNLDVPLVEAIDRRTPPTPEWFVVEASSFRLERVTRFRPRVGAWLNLAPDHLDWHPDMDAYASAKARIWAGFGSDDVKVIPHGDSEISRYATAAAGRTVTFGVTRGDVRVEDGQLLASAAVTESGADEVIVDVEDLQRRLPHDLANAAAAVACALSAGASIKAMGDELTEFGGLPHRMALIGSIDGVDYYDDSKATTPEATVAALAGFSSAVLIAGGSDKGIDLGALATAHGHLIGVVAIGETSERIVEIFEGLIPVTVAASMAAALDAAAEYGREAEAVVLSPACASFDWYMNYAERGDDFSRIVNDLMTRGNE